ncbi:MAG: hypothetical protein HY658_14930 [Actinobacteria bacterium]|nr:hypothetical protein [Actinomycetota bacterium]
MSQTEIDRLTEEVTRRVGRLEGPAEAVAVLESIGITDDEAREMGRADVFQLGYEVFEHQAEDAGARRLRLEVESEFRQEELDSRRPTGLGTFLPRFFLKGFTFGAPMVIMIFAVLILLYSLWAYFYFDIPRGTAIAVGIVASYLVTAGFMQAIGRRGLMYLRQDMQVLSLKISMLMVLLGIVTVVVTGILFWLFLSLFPVIAPDEIPVAILYFVSLSLLWLGLSIVYMLQQEIWFSIAIAIGIGVVYYLREYLNTSIIVAHQAGIIAAAVIGLVIGIVLLSLREARLRRGRKQPLAGKLPRFSVIVYSVAPYFAYGLVYFGFLFTDRIMSWTGRADFRQYFFWFQSDYEVGLNWALISLLFSLGVLEFTVYRLGELVPFLSQTHSVLRTRQFTGEITSFYRRSVLAYVVAAVVGAIIAYFVVQALVPHIPLLDTLLNDTSVYVFIVASISYLLVVWSLLNNVFLFSFSRPAFALKAATAALIVNLVVGFLLSRIFVYWFAVFGLLAGAIVFWALSTYYTVKMLRNLDYYSYSAF